MTVFHFAVFYSTMHYVSSIQHQTLPNYYQNQKLCNLNMYKTWAVYINSSITFDLNTSCRNSLHRSKIFTELRMCLFHCSNSSSNLNHLVQDSCFNDSKFSKFIGRMSIPCSRFTLLGSWKIYSKNVPPLLENKWLFKLD